MFAGALEQRFSQSAKTGKSCVSTTAEALEQRCPRSELFIRSTSLSAYLSLSVLQYFFVGGLPFRNYPPACCVTVTLPAGTRSGAIRMDSKDLCIHHSGAVVSGRPTRARRKLCAPRNVSGRRGNAPQPDHLVSHVSQRVRDKMIRLRLATCSSRKSSAVRPRFALCSPSPPSLNNPRSASCVWYLPGRSTVD